MKWALKTLQMDRKLYFLSSENDWVSPFPAKISRQAVDPTYVHWHPSLLRGRFQNTYLIGPQVKSKT